ncbi:hypothetical protein K7957_05005 [Sphingomonas yunnanensis]|uniref:hypothetical protein n=1 Tax=Sphingomonas yunnanensis TaxID=310400 RepID=UPI001CA636DD|nr:hypothetical protein [Sphingomonas yunnanensis]MBY9062287.1 hypothetical protein [Sphingomonas yunnanensis]
MASTTAAGTGLAISAGAPAGQTAAAYGALSYTEIGNVESIGGFGAATEVVTFQPLKGPLQKYKGPTNYGSLTPTIALDDADAGQALLAIAAAPTNSALYAIRVTKPDGSLRYFQVRVFGMPETIGAANTMITAAPVLEINTVIVKVSAAGGGTPTPTPTPTPSPTLTAPSTFAARYSPSQTFALNNGTYSTSFDGTAARAMAPSAGTTWYVDPTAGTDGTGVAGTRAAPYKNLGWTLTNKAQPGDTVRIINMTGDVVMRSSNAWPAAPGFAGSVAIINETPQYRLLLAAASSGTVNNWSQNATYPQVYQNARSAVPTTVVDGAVKAYAYRKLASGSGYAVNDTVTLSNGAIIKVLGVSSGAIRVWSVVTPASSLVTGTVTQTATSGSGSGVTFQSQSNAPAMFATAAKAASLAACAATRGTWFDDGTNTYYNPADGRAVAASSPLIVLCANGRDGVPINTAGVTQYFEGIDVIGGTGGIVSTYTGNGARAQIVLNGSSVQGTNSNGLGIVSNAQVYGYRAGIYNAGQDNWNWHNNGGTSVTGAGSTGLLNECVGFGAGTIGGTLASTSDNDFTAHEDCAVVLVNCVACGSDDRTVAFIDTSYLWMLGGFIGTSKTAATSQITSSSVDLSNQAIIWLDGVTVEAPAGGDAEAYRINSGTLNYRNVTPVPTTTGAGTVASY